MLATKSKFKFNEAEVNTISSPRAPTSLAKDMGVMVWPQIQFFLSFNKLVTLDPIVSIHKKVRDKK